VLDVKGNNTIISEPVNLDASLTLVLQNTPHHPKWEKQVPRPLVISTLDAHGRALYLLVRVKTVDTSETCSVRALLDSGATGSFVDRDFIRTHQISTWKLSYPVHVFNMDGTPNEAREISEVANVVVRISEDWLV